MPHNEILSSRWFPHAPDALFEAFSDPNQLTRWFGPQGFTSTFEKFDFHPGGEWLFVFHGPDGTDHVNRNVFADIVPAERIVFDHVLPPQFRMIMTITPESAGALLEWRMIFETAEICETLKDICVPANEENFDRLAAHLDTMA